VITTGRRCFGHVFGLGVMAVASGGWIQPFHPNERQTPSSSAILVDGLKIWRKPGAIDGGAACATCHSPDGIELAAYNFDDADLRRRAVPHLGDSDSQLLVEYIHALRAKFKLFPLRDPNLDRPLQPGGSVLPGDTPAERDLAFGLELRSKLPRLFGSRIETIPEAKAAEQELLALQPVNLRVGIPFSRLSEDVAHGNEHASIAQWFPEVPPLVPAASLDAWYASEDQYLENPTPERLRALLLQHVQFVRTSRMLGLGAMSANKFRALLVLQDRIRNHTEKDPLNVSRDVRPIGSFNAIWNVGDNARDVMDQGPAAVGMSPETQLKKLAGPSFRDQLHQLRVAWFWAGWLSDQGLFKTSRDDKTRLGMWFSESLSKDGPYPIHDVYANARRQAVVTNDIDAWGETMARRRRIWDFAGLRSFEYEWKDLPKDPNYRKLYVQFASNCFRMNLLLLQDDIQRTHLVWTKVSTESSATTLVTFMKIQDPQGAASAERIKQELFKVIDGATERFNYRGPKTP